MTLNQAFPIVDHSGTMSDAFRTWTQGVDLGTPILYAGNPDGVVEARQYQLCINTTGTTGSLIYVKMLPDVGGDRRQGWVAA